MEHKTKRMSFKMDEYDEEEGVFSGYGAVFENVDSGGDIIEAGAFKKALEAGCGRVKILALHNDCWLPIGKPLELREDEKGLFLKAKISDTSMGKDIKILLKDEVLNELSIGYEPVVFDYDEKGIRHLKEVDLWEVSVVTWAMNPEAVITDYKSATVAATNGIMQEIKEGRKISDARLKSLKEVSRSMKESAGMIDAVISEAGAKKKSVSRRRTPGSRKARNIEIVF